MARAEYAKAKGFRITGDPQALGQEIETLRRKKGFLTPQLLVQQAARKGSKLHAEFEWDDSAAAQSWRIEQAQYLLRAIVLIRQPQNGDPALVRAFVHLQDEDEGPIYTSLSVAMGDAAMRAQVLRRAWQELEGWKRRYSEYEELAHVFSAMEEHAKAV